MQNFPTAAAGIAAAMEVTRVSNVVATVGRFRVDVTRSILYVLLPTSIVPALLFTLVL